MKNLSKEETKLQSEQKTLQQCKDEVAKKYANGEPANWMEFWHDCLSYKRFQSLHLAMDEAAELYASQFKEKHNP